MKDLSLHILDIAMNSVQAGATQIYIRVFEDVVSDTFVIDIEDNGKGMPEAVLKEVMNPYYTSRNKKTGLGIPLLAQQAEATGGWLNIQSEGGKGAQITATFQHSHVDRQPLGDITATLISLVRSYPAINFFYHHTVNGKQFELNTGEIKAQLDDVPIQNPDVLKYLKDLIFESIKEIST